MFSHCAMVPTEFHGEIVSHALLRSKWSDY